MGISCVDRGAPEATALANAQRRSPARALAGSHRPPAARACDDPAGRTAARQRSMGNQGSADRGQRNGGEGSGDGGGRGRDKKKSFLNCQCGKGRDDKDEINSEGRTKGTKLTEEEWAKVKSGRMHVDRGQPDLVLEEADHSKVPSRSRLYKEGGGADSTAAEGRSADAGAGAKLDKNPYRSSSRSEKPQVKAPERFKAGDRVKCACKKWCACPPPSKPVRVPACERAANPLEEPLAAHLTVVVCA